MPCEGRKPCNNDPWPSPTSKKVEPLMRSWPWRCVGEASRTSFDPWRQSDVHSVIHSYVGPWCTIFSSDGLGRNNVRWFCMPRPGVVDHRTFCPPSAPPVAFRAIRFSLPLARGNIRFFLALFLCNMFFSVIHWRIISLHPLILAAPCRDSHPVF